MTPRAATAAEALVVIALVAAGAWLRIAGLSAWQLSWDDMWHLMDASQPDLASVLQRNLHEQVHGPLAYVLRYGLLSLTHDPLWLRLTSLAPGLLLVPVFHWLGRELLGRAAGLFLAGTAAFADILVGLSQVLRAYALLLLLVSLALALLARSTRTGSRSALAGYFACATLAAYTHVSAFVPLAVLAVAGAWRAGRSGREVRLRRLAAWLAPHALLLGPALAWSAAQLHFSGGRSPDPAANLGGFLERFSFLRSFFPDSPLDALARLADAYRVLFFGPEAGWARSAALLALTAAGCGALVREGRGGILALCAGVVALGMALGLAGIYPFDASRHCVYAIPFLVLPAAASVEWLAARVDARLLGAAALAAVLLGVRFDPEHARRLRADFDTRRADLELVLGALAERAGPRDVALVNRVGMQYLNLAEQLAGEPLGHVAHASDHWRYPYDRWVQPGGEEHVYRGVRVVACDGPHEWSSFLGAPRLLRRCLEPVLARPGAGAIENVWILVPMSEAFLVFAAPRPLEAARRLAPDVRDFLIALQGVPFWQLFFTGSVARVWTPTAGAVAVPLPDLEREWQRLGAPPTPNRRGGPP